MALVSEDVLSSVSLLFDRTHMVVLSSTGYVHTAVNAKAIHVVCARRGPCSVAARAS